MWNDLTAVQRRAFTWVANQYNAASRGGRDNWTGQEVALLELQIVANRYAAERQQRKLDARIAQMSAQDLDTFLGGND